MKSTSIVPDPIKSAVTGLLAPYGLSYESLSEHHPPDADETRYLSVEAACRYCSVSKWTLIRAVKSGRLRQIKLSSTKQGKSLYDRYDLDNFMKKYKSK
jgi:Helix-turn-helix domain